MSGKIVIRSDFIITHQIHLRDGVSDPIRIGSRVYAFTASNDRVHAIYNDAREGLVVEPVEHLEGCLVWFKEDVVVLVGFPTDLSENETLWVRTLLQRMSSLNGLICMITALNEVPEWS